MWHPYNIGQTLTDIKKTKTIDPTSWTTEDIPSKYTNQEIEFGNRLRVDKQFLYRIKNYTGSLCGQSQSQWDKH